MRIDDLNLDPESRNERFRMMETALHFSIDFFFFFSFFLTRIAANNEIPRCFSHFSGRKMKVENCNYKEFEFIRFNYSYNDWNYFLLNFYRYQIRYSIFFFNMHEVWKNVYVENICCEYNRRTNLTIRIYIFIYFIYFQQQSSKLLTIHNVYYTHAIVTFTYNE